MFDLLAAFGSLPEFHKQVDNVPMNGHCIQWLININFLTYTE